MTNPFFQLKFCNVYFFFLLIVKSLLILSLLITLRKLVISSRLMFGSHRIAWVFNISGAA